MSYGLSDAVPHSLLFGYWEPASPELVDKVPGYAWITILDQRLIGALVQHHPLDAYPAARTTAPGILRHSLLARTASSLDPRRIHADD